jgi:hypothetical protein
MNTSKKTIKSLAEGILSYYVYLTKCGVSSSISEYTLYEPFFRMLNKNKGMMVSCEYPVLSETLGRGDKRRIDFVIQQIPDTKSTKGKNKTKEEPIILYAIEMKLLKKAGKHFNRKSFDKDKEKLLALQGKQETKFGKFIFALHKTNKYEEALAGSSDRLNSLIHCEDATYRLDVIEVL